MGEAEGAECRPKFASLLSGGLASLPPMSKTTSSTATDSVIENILLNDSGATDQRTRHSGAKKSGKAKLDEMSAMIDQKVIERAHMVSVCHCKCYITCMSVCHHINLTIIFPTAK